MASGALAAGVISEAVYVGLRIRPVLRDQLRQAPPIRQPLTARAFLAFYVPLAMTSMINLAAEPPASAALSRMPSALES